MLLAAEKPNPQTAMEVPLAGALVCIISTGERKINVFDPKITPAGASFSNATSLLGEEVNLAALGRCSAYLPATGCRLVGSGMVPSFLPPTAKEQ